MINRIIKIKGVGRFQNYSISGDMALRKATIIYGENGHGKTTLSNIIKSLSSGNHAIVTNRLSIGQEEQKIKIDVGGVVHSFQDGQWQGGGVGSRIEVFDSFFINENVYSGFDFSLEHSKSLHKFILGEEGVRLSKLIEENKEEIATQKKDLRILEASIQTQLGRESLQVFLKLAKDEAIDSKVADATQKLEIAKQAKEINEKPYLGFLQSIDLGKAFIKIKASLETSLDSISGSYINDFETHKAKLEKKGLVNAEDWLYDGFKAQIAANEKDKCVFCNQAINDVDIIKSYNQYFNNKYIKLQKSVSAQAQWLGELSYDSTTKNNEINLISNVALFDYWTNHCSITRPTVEVDFRAVRASIEINAVKESVHRKLQSLLEKQDASNADALITLLCEVNEDVRIYNLSIDEINKAIAKVKSYDVSIVTAAGQLAYLTLVQRRHCGELEEACKDHETLTLAIKQNNVLKTQLKDQLKAYSEGFMSRYGASINHYLQVFFPGGYYQLGNIDSAYPGNSKEASADFTLTILGHPITFSEKPGLPQGKYTLSEGDKSSIAFAFFLSKLALDDIGDKIIVFDDPITSLDKNRRRRTIDAIVSILGKAKQVIILSHSTTFVYDIYEKCADSKVIRIAYGGILEDYASINEDMQSEYVKKLRLLEGFLVDPTDAKISEARGAIRIVLEDNLKFRFHGFLYKSYVNSSGATVGPFNNKAGLGKMVDILDASPCTFRKDKSEVIAELHRLNELSNPDHHGGHDREHRTEAISVGELVGYVQDTIRMIDEKL